MGCSWDKVEFGSTGLKVAPLGLASSYGATGADVEYAFERGLNYFYWGSARTPTFGKGLRQIARSHRTDLVIVIQSYTRIASLLGISLDRALSRLKIDYADVLLLGWWNKLPPRRLLDAAQRLRDQGKVKHLMLSGHNRRAFPDFAREAAIDAIMVRYNAAHTGAEREVFPALGERKVGVVSYTATRWGALLDPKLTPAGERTPSASDCYRFVLSNPHVQVALIGPKNRTQLEEGLSTLDKGPLSDGDLDWMRRVGKAVHTSKGWLSRILD